MNKNILARLESNTELLLGLVNNVSDIPFILDSKGDILFIGDQIKKYGLTKKEIYSKKFFEFINDDDKRFVVKKFKNSLKNPKFDEMINFRIKTKKGIFEFQEKSNFKIDKKYGLIIFGILRDITQEKKLINDLAKFHSENNNPIMKISYDYKILYSNSASDNLIKIFEKDKKLDKKFKINLKKVIKNKKENNLVLNIEEKVYSFDFIYIDKENYINIYGKDVTSEISNLKLLEENQKEFEDLFQNMADCFAYHEIILDENKKPINYKFIRVNKSFEKLMGVDSKKIIGKNVLDIFPKTKNDNIDWVKEYGEVALKMKPKNFEIHSNNWEKTFSIKVYSPKKGFFVTIFTDISEEFENRKQIEYKVRELETLSRIAISREKKMIELKERIQELEDEDK